MLSGGFHDPMKTWSSTERDLEGWLQIMKRLTHESSYMQEMAISADKHCVGGPMFEFCFVSKYRGRQIFLSFSLVGLAPVEDTVSTSEYRFH